MCQVASAAAFHQQPLKAANTHTHTHTVLQTHTDTHQHQQPFSNAVHTTPYANTFPIAIEKPKKKKKWAKNKNKLRWQELSRDRVPEKRNPEYRIRGSRGRNVGTSVRDMVQISFSRLAIPREGSLLGH